MSRFIDAHRDRVGVEPICRELEVLSQRLPCPPEPATLRSRSARCLPDRADPPCPRREPRRLRPAQGLGRAQRGRCAGGALHGRTPDAPLRHRRGGSGQDRQDHLPRVTTGAGRRPRAAQLHGQSSRPALARRLHLCAHLAGLGLPGRRARRPHAPHRRLAACASHAPEPGLRRLRNGSPRPSRARRRLGSALGQRRSG